MKKYTNKILTIMAVVVIICIVVMTCKIAEIVISSI